jgi:ribosome-binding factor A
MADLLAVASQRDAAVAALANGASYAGDPDPYRKPVVASDDDDDDDDDDDATDGDATDDDAADKSNS